MMLAQMFHDFSRDAMGPTAIVTLHVAIAGYIIAALLSLGALFQPGRLKMAWADAVGGVATLALGVYFIARFFEAGTRPLQNMFEVISLSALFLALIYFVATRVKKLPSVGAFAFPALAVIFLVNLLLAGTATSGVEEPLSSPVLILHILLTIFAYGVFFMATVAAIMFLLQERVLKKRQDPNILRSFPPLESLRQLVDVCIWVGLALLTGGFALGFASFAPADWEGVWHNPKIISGVVLWLVLLTTLVGRRVGVLHGRRHFYLVLVGFVLVLTTYVGLGILEARGSANRTAVVLSGEPCTVL